jgi:hypothetical protein
MSTPAVSVLGSPPHVLPHFALLAWAAPAVLQTIRVPIRLGIATFVGVVVLTGVGFAESTRRLPRTDDRGKLVRAALAVALGALMYVESGLAGPSAYRLVEAPRDHRSPLGAALRRRSGPLLELPVGARGVEPAAHARAMYRSTSHWRPLLNGYSSYWPAGFPGRMALARRLPDPSALRALVRETGLRTVLVRAHGYRVPEERAVWESLAARGGTQGLRLLAREGPTLLFAVEDDASSTDPG